MQAEDDVVRLDAAAGPPDFAAFFADEHAGLVKLLYFVTANRADAADLAQEAFVKLWERWDRLDRLYRVGGDRRWVDDRARRPRRVPWHEHRGG
jgi:DNA-directed RNA polymerase specialized sigma24 family protein